MARDGEVIQRQHFCHHGDTIFDPKSGYVRTKLHGASTCGCNNNAIFSGRAIFNFPAVVVDYAGRVYLTASKHWRFMPKWKHGSTVELIIFRFQDFLFA